MPVREYAPLCLTRAPAGVGPKRLGVDRRRPGMIEGRHEARQRRVPRAPPAAIPGGSAVWRAR
nr:MAG: hypothetical protein DIU52_05120 [bacterium]